MYKLWLRCGGEGASGSLSHLHASQRILQNTKVKNQAKNESDLKDTGSFFYVSFDGILRSCVHWFLQNDDKINKKSPKIDVKK